MSKSTRQATAERIVKERAKRSNKAQLERLEAKGHGSCKEAQRLRRAIAEEQKNKKTSAN